MKSSNLRSIRAYLNQIGGMGGIRGSTKVMYLKFDAPHAVRACGPAHGWVHCLSRLSCRRLIDLQERYVFIYFTPTAEGTRQHGPCLFTYRPFPVT
eukprot:4239588-Prymnesium_polylepis.2